MSAAGTVLAPLRDQIDAVDAEMVALLARRFAIVRGMAGRKARAGIAARLDDRVEAVLACAEAEAAGCPPALAAQVWRTMIDWTIGEERHLAGAETGSTP